ncbi:MAG: DsrE family protein [Gammaproteobacteria bacterium]
MPMHERRNLLRWITAGVAALAGGKAAAHHTETHFAEQSAHRIVYQCNKADADYLGHILFSVGELIRKYGDDVEIVVAAFGPGIHLLADIPRRPIPEELRARASSLAAYGVAFHACGNTMKSLEWTADDLVEFAEVVPIGVEDMMLLQERGFAYVAW